MENKDLEKRINETLDLNINRSEPKPFFYTRLRVKLETKHQNKNSLVINLIPKPLIASLLLVIILNMAWFGKILTTTSKYDGKEAFSRAFQLTVTDTYYP